MWKSSVRSAPESSGGYDTAFFMLLSRLSRRVQPIPQGIQRNSEQSYRNPSIRSLFVPSPLISDVSIHGVH
jgi:hypothetical protein